MTRLGSRLATIAATVTACIALSSCASASQPSAQPAPTTAVSGSESLPAASGSTTQTTLPQGSYPNGTPENVKPIEPSTSAPVDNRPDVVRVDPRRGTTDCDIARDIIEFIAQSNDMPDAQAMREAVQTFQLQGEAYKKLGSAVADPVEGSVWTGLGKSALAAGEAWKKAAGEHFSSTKSLEAIALFRLDYADAYERYGKALDKRCGVTLKTPTPQTAQP